MQLFRHYKGGLYTKIGDALHTETGETLVVYRSQDDALWVRPKAMFEETLSDGRRRFEPV